MRLARRDKDRCRNFASENLRRPLAVLAVLVHNNCKVEGAILVIEAGCLELYPIEDADTVFQGFDGVSNKANLFEERLVGAATEGLGNFTLKLYGKNSCFEVPGYSQGQIPRVADFVDLERDSDSWEVPRLVPELLSSPLVF